MSRSKRQRKVSYVPATGSKFTKSDAEVIGPEIDRIAKSLGGKATAKGVLDAARATESPLHRFFEWDDSKAAEKYRLDQARYMLRSIEIRYVSATGPVQTRAYQVIRGDGERPGYVPAQVLLSSEEMTREIVERAKSEAASWYKRYERIRSVAALSPVFEAIEQSGIVTPAEAVAAE